MASTMRVAVVKSDSRSCSRTTDLGRDRGRGALHHGAIGAAPHGGMVHGLRSRRRGRPQNPPVTTGPCATAYTWPSAPRSEVSTRMPPCRLVASPMAAAVESMRMPGWAKAGRVAVTITAAVFFTRMVVGETATPIRSSILVRLWLEKMVCWRVAGSRQPDHHAVADQLVFADAFHRNQIFQTGRRSRRPGQPAGTMQKAMADGLHSQKGNSPNSRR